MRKLNIRPDTGVYGTYKRLSYEAWTALAEFVDNSTQSYYDNREKLRSTKYWRGLEIQINYYEDRVNGDELVIIDNAYGMNYSDFQRAIILDRPPLKTTGRNEFGMGLKAAACWFGNLWSVETTELGSNVKYKAEVDIDNLIKYKNEEIDVEETPANPREHFTIVTIKKLNKKIKGKRIENKIHELLSSIYRADLRTQEIRIFYNGNELKFNEVTPYVDENGKTWTKDIDFTIPYKDDEELRVKGFIGIRLPGSPQNAGYTLLRRGRVIVGGPEKNYRPKEIFGLSNSYRYQRLYGELEMDNWPVTQSKDAFDWSNDDLEAEFIKKLDELSSEFKEKAEMIRVRQKVKIEDLTEGLKKSFKDNEKIKLIDVKFNDEDKQTSLIQVNESENDENSEIDSGDLDESAGLGVEIDINTPFESELLYNGKTYIFKTILDDSNSHADWIVINSTPEDNKYDVVLNQIHPFFYPFIQKGDFIILLIRLSYALAISELEAFLQQGGYVSPSFIRISMGRVLEALINENGR